MFEKTFSNLLCNKDKQLKYEMEICPSTSFGSLHHFVPFVHKNGNFLRQKTSLAEILLK